MSTYFSKVIKAGERQREFNFRQINKGVEPQYSVDVPDEKGNRVMFQMHKSEDGAWKTSVQQLPEWVQDAENALAAAIEENAVLEMKRKR
ncbi:MAG TPA: hypothetical protein VGC29_03125 [Flavisolibacter sp.]